MNHSLRRTRLTEGLPEKSVIFVSAAELVQESNDAEYPFSQDRNFWYLTGVNKSDCLLILAPGYSQFDEALCIPDFSEFSSVWLDAQLNEDTARELSGIKTVVRNREKLDVVRGILQWASHVYTAKAQHKSDIEGMHRTNTEPTLRTWLKKYGASEIQDITPQLTKLRMVKDQDELAQIDSSIQVTNQAFSEIGPLVAPGTYEYELEAAAYSVIKKQNYDWGYLPIVASGADSCVLHSQKNNKQLQNNNALLIDMGARRGYYSADITRSMWVGSKNKEYERLHDVVEQLQQFAIDIIKPGKTLHEVVRPFRESFLEQLKLLGLLDETATVRDTLQFMPHGISHHLGLDVHDLADYSAPLEPGMVITVEPGIYLKDQGVGVRIEDDILVTASGSKVLGV